MGNLIDRSSARPLLPNEVGELICVGCETLLGCVQGNMFLGDPAIVTADGVGCRVCRPVRGKPVRTKLSETLPLYSVVPSSPQPYTPKKLAWISGYCYELGSEEEAALVAAGVVSEAEVSVEVEALVAA